MGAIDIQGEGKLAMLPPSTHPETGRQYEIENFQEPLKLSQEEVDYIMDALKGIMGSKTSGELADETINKIVELIIPYWRSGQRDNLEWPLLGYMRKHGIPYDTAKIILERIISLTGDEEASMRRAVLERNYFKLSPEKLEGYTGLKEILQEQDLKLLEKYVKTLAGEDIPKNTPAGKKGKATKEKEEEEKIKKVPYIDLEDDLYLAVWDGKDNYKFAHLARNGEIELLDKVEIDGITYLPREKKNILGQEIPVGYPTFDIVKVPDMSTEGLVKALKLFIWKYVDMKPDEYDLVIYYILATWFYRKTNTTAYLRFIGDTGKGKTRMLNVIGDLCFYPVKFGGGATEPAIRRTQEKFHGTLVLNEADLKGGKANEMIKYLNAGTEKKGGGFATVEERKGKNGEKERYTAYYDPFSPKILAMREPFPDAATEGRTLSIEPYQTHRKDIPVNLPLEYDEEVILLRNAIARWTLKNWKKVKFENYEFIQNLPIEPRLKQMVMPLSIILPLFGEGQDKMKNSFVQWLLKRQEEIIKHRANSLERQIFNAIVDLAEGETEEIEKEYGDYLYDPLRDGSDYTYEESEENRGKPLVITTGMIAKKTKISIYKINNILRELGFEVVKKRLKIKDKWKSPHVVILKDAQRWEEAWERYRGFGNVGEIPAILKDEHIDYENELVPEIPEITPQINIDTLKRINNDDEKLLYGVNTGITGTNPLAGDKRPSFLEFPGVGRRKLYTKARIGIDGKVKPIRISQRLYTRVWAMEDFKVALPSGVDGEYTQGDIIVVDRGVAEILMKSGKVDLDWTLPFQKMEVMDMSPEEFPEVGKITVKWENPCLSIA